MNINGMVPGHCYRVTWDDCCVKGWLEDTFISYELDEEGDPGAAEFVTARIENLWGRYEVEEVNRK